MRLNRSGRYAFVLSGRGGYPAYRNADLFAFPAEHGSAAIFDGSKPLRMQNSEIAIFDSVLIVGQDGQ